MTKIKLIYGLDEVKLRRHQGAEATFTYQFGQGNDAFQFRKGHSNEARIDNLVLTSLDPRIFLSGPNGLEIGDTVTITIEKGKH